jgi:hypothetical protein
MKNNNFSRVTVKECSYCDYLTCRKNKKCKWYKHYIKSIGNTKRKRWTKNYVEY